MVGTLQHARLGYTSAVEVPHYVCHLLQYADKIDLDDFSSELLGEKQNAIIKSMSWRAEETEHATLPTLEDELFVDPDCVGYSDVELQQTTVNVIVQDKTQTQSSSGILWVEITYLTFSSLLIYLLK